MTGPTAAPMRRKCQWCKSPFRPKRSDAGFCSNLCRQAAHRKRAAGIKADSVFKAKLQIAENAHDATHQLEWYQSGAATLHIEADARDIKVRFMGTPWGILAAEEVPGALKQAMARTDWSEGVTRLRMCRETKGHSADPEVSAILKQETVGGSFIAQECEFIAQECERACRALLKEPRDVSLFVWDWDYFVSLNPPCKAPMFDWDDEIFDRADDQFLDGKDLLAGGGYQVEKP